ncbi:MAG: hypothetical protein R3F11_23125 [Verrucomicrobiales bacterium]
MRRPHPARQHARCAASPAPSRWKAASSQPGGVLDLNGGSAGRRRLPARTDLGGGNFTLALGGSG